MVPQGLAVAEALRDTGVGVTVVDPRWVIPVPESVVSLAAEHDLVVSIEDGIIHGGVGAMISAALSAAGIDTPMRHLAFPEVFPEHASRDELLEEVGLSPQRCVATVSSWVNQLFRVET